MKPTQDAAVAAAHCRGFHEGLADGLRAAENVHAGQAACWFAAGGLAMLGGLWNWGML